MEACRSACQSHTGTDTIILHSTQTEYVLNYQHRLDWRAPLCSKTGTTATTYCTALPCICGCVIILYFGVFIITIKSHKVLILYIHNTRRHHLCWTVWGINDPVICVSTWLNCRVREKDWINKCCFLMEIWKDYFWITKDSLRGFPQVLSYVCAWGKASYWKSMPGSR